MPIKRSKLAWLASLLGVTALILNFATAWLWYDYADTRPRVRQPETGRIYAHSTQGTVVYLTIGEQMSLWGLLVSGLGSMCAAMAIARRTKTWIF